MIQTKILEVRDSGTFIPIVAVELNGSDHYLLRASGYAPRRYIGIARLNKGLFTYNAFDHGIARTLQVAHQHIIENWDSLKSGDVVDVEFILGETKEPKISQQFENNGEYAL